ncbi:MAG: pyridoxal phosphate-dependent aminotransferase [archaeon]
MVSDKFKEISASETLAINAKANELKEKGFNVINFSVGEPDFNSPENVKQAGINALKENFTRYTAAAGIKPLKQKIKEKLLKDNSLDYSLDQIVVCNGAKQALYNAVMVLCNKGDEVIVPAPYWVSYSAMVLLADAKPVFTCNESLKITPEEFENSVTKKTKALFLNSPSNPTGLMYSKKELEELAEIAVKKKVFVLSDEVYEKIVFDEKHYSIASFNDEIKALTITVNSVSKSHSMTGYRIGYTASNNEISSAMQKIQSHSTGSACSFSQKAALAAFDSDKIELQKQVQEFKKRRDLIAAQLKNSKIKFILPQGAFYFFFNLKEITKDDVKFCADLLEKKYVALVPGTPFGMKGYARMSYACSLDEITEGIKRIKEFVQ